MEENESGKRQGKCRSFTLRKLKDGYLPQRVSTNGDICSHCGLDAALKWTIDTPAISGLYA